MSKITQPSISLPKLLTIQQVAEHTQFSTRKIRRLIKSKELPAIKFGRSWRIAENDLALYLASRKSL